MRESDENEDRLERAGSTHADQAGSGIKEPWRAGPDAVGGPAGTRTGSPAGIDTSVAHNARVWNYWLGGKDNYAADRGAGDHVLSLFPSIVDVARADRAFLQRAVRHLAGEVGLRQFLDIGTGLPTAENTHEVAQAVAPESRVVYADNDPLVLVHARALLTSRPPGATDYIEADIREPETILEAAAATLDPDRPVGLMLLGVLNFVPDTEEARAVVARLVAELAPGSYVALTHPTLEMGGEANAEAMAFWNENATPPITPRTVADITAFADGLEIVEPGVVSCAEWRPEPDDAGAPRRVPQVGIVARKP
ncbi:O-methyltransferase involved in polyketide biosynthesis [Streptomonospora salina]|uniref:O-methyltransferase involved in polyketide biosynthesis n=1 Tax=Streptomonospora salina TaxID=104205 RepID=A0A841EAB9_9ACTN|nr:O-methyltransferase involved in polyketide biosynthesis [Streptomonospora salina]